jgi:folate-dependent phosphoribosylglycinamide formyltransferase PurN
MTPKPRVVALVADGLYQRYLVSRLAAETELVGVVVYAPPNARGSMASRVSRYASPARLFRHLHARIAMRAYAKEAQPLLEKLFFDRGRAPAISDSVPQLRVDNINVPTAVEFVRGHAPDVVCVNGTNLLREPMLALILGIRHGILNLHTGLSPYSRGGNCDLFMLLEGHPELVGITIHHIDKGIDSGDIVITARPELAVGDSYEMIEAKCFRLGIDMMLVAVRQIVESRAERVKQWEAGKLFLRRTGYVYEPWQRVRVNQMLARGLIADYLDQHEERDRGVRLVGRTD